MRFTSLSICAAVLSVVTIAAPVDNNPLQQFSQYFRGSQLSNPSKAITSTTTNNKQQQGSSYRIASNKMIDKGYYNDFGGVAAPDVQLDSSSAPPATIPERFASSSTAEDYTPTDPFVGAQDRTLEPETRNYPGRRGKGRNVEDGASVDEPSRLDIF